MASKKDFLSPAVVALPVEKKRKEKRGLETGLWLMLAEAFLSVFLKNYVSYSIICKK